MTHQEARPLEVKEGSGGDAPNPALLGEPRSMKQSELDDYQYSGSQQWRDEDVLEQLYVNEELSTSEIAEILGCSPPTVRNWMEKFGIERRGYSESTHLAQRSEVVPFYLEHGSYPGWVGSHKGRSEHLLSHRLLAVSEFGFDALYGKVVHHKNGCKIDNRPENLELITQAEHMDRHHTLFSWLDKIRIAGLYRGGDVSQRDLGEMFGCSNATIHRVLQEVEGCSDNG